MRLRNLFMILLLCMTVGMFGVSCTGDDGAQGPKGDTGEQGPPGDDGADAGDATNSYSFLTSWGHPTGEVSCNDPIFQNTKPFPGPEMLETRTDGNGVAQAASFEAQCGDSALATVMLPDLGMPGIVAGTGTSFIATGAKLVFVKTMTGAIPANTNNPTAIPPTDISRAVSVVTETKFAGGPFFAEISGGGGTSEYVERLNLYSECRGTTAPPAIKGEWRGVWKQETRTPINPASLEGDTANNTVVTTTKICVRLDSLTGAVKCFINEGTDPPGDATDETHVQQIAIYDGEAMEEADKIMKLLPLPLASAVTLGVPTETNGTTVVSNEGQDFFDEGATVTTIFSAGGEVGKLCNLFSGGLTSN